MPIGNTINGSAGDDIITPFESAPGQPFTTANDDVVEGGSGYDVIDGADGRDIAVYSGAFADYSISYNAALAFAGIRDMRSGAPDGEDSLYNVERLRFADGTYDLASGAFFPGGAGGPPVIVPASGDFIANTSTAGDQRSGDVTVLANGNFLVTYSTRFASSDIRGQIFDPSGARIGGEIFINDVIIYDQYPTDVTALVGGGFVVTWIDSSTVARASGGEHFSFDTVVRVFDASGVAISGDVIVGTRGQREIDTNYQYATNMVNPSTTALANGGFAVAWQDNDGFGGDASGDSIKLRFFNASGVATSTESVVNSATADNQTAPHIATLSNGNLVVTWLTDAPTGDRLVHGVQAQILTANGAKVGSELTIANIPAPWDYGALAVESLANGGFVASWSDNDASLGDTGKGVKMQVFDNSGSVVSAVIQVNTVGIGDQSNPAIVAFAGGGFVISWDDSSGLGGDASDYGIKAQYFDDLGTKVGSEVVLNGATAGSQFSPSLAALSPTSFIAVWDHQDPTSGDGSGYAIKAGIYDITLIAGANAPEGTDAILGVQRNTDHVFTAADFGFSDADGNAFAAVIISSAPTSGTLTLNGVAVSDGDAITVADIASGLLRYAAPAGQVGSGVDAIGFQVTDDSSGTNAVDQSPNILTISIYGSVINGTPWDEEISPSTVPPGQPAVDDDGQLIYGNDGNDFIITGTGFNIVHGGEGDDYIHSYVSNGLLYGDGGNDTIYGGDDARLYGGDGDDLLQAGNGDVLLDGGAGIDKAVLFFAYEPGPITFDGSTSPSTFVTVSGTISLVSIEAYEITGSAFDDVLTGGVYNDVFIAGSFGSGAGVDRFYGGDGDDTFYFYEAGGGIVDGGSGYNTLILLQGTLPSGIVVDLATGFFTSSFGTTTVLSIQAGLVSGTAFADSFIGGTGGDSLQGGAGDDIFTGNGGGDYFDGGDGTDTAVFTGDFSDYRIAAVSDQFQIDDLRSGSPDGLSNYILNVEILRFADGDYRYDAATGGWVPVTGGNQAPTGTADSYTIAEDGVLTIAAASGVLANDSDADGDTLIAALVAGVAHGTLSLAANGGFTYRPNANYFGPDSFTYTLSDGTATTGPITVTLNVTPLNDDPVALGDSGFAARYETPLTILSSALLANDIDIDGDLLSISTVQGATHGSVALIGGNVVFTPAAGYSGAASFAYTVDDGNGGTSTATVSLMVSTSGVGSPLVDRTGTVTDIGPGNTVLTGTSGADTFFFDTAGGTTGQDRITQFGPDDVLVTTTKLPDSNNDGIITFGSNAMLDFDAYDAGGNALVLGGIASRKGLRYLGESGDGFYAYASAAVRPRYSKEGFVSQDDVLSGGAVDSKRDIFFVDTALGTDLGDDRIVNFGARDILVTTTKLSDPDNDEQVGFGTAGLLLADGGSLHVSSTAGADLAALSLAATTSHGGVTYFIYGTPGATPDTGLIYI